MIVLGPAAAISALEVRPLIPSLHPYARPVALLGPARDVKGPKT